ncbi:hypothetical protein H2203_004529 [Taxawa tesnikishii (nom. ined.)]|nr:hypothetical protein H2203_004529 [Dothideales sp. JES 119]
MEIRNAQKSDFVAIADIYNHYVKHSIATFEEELLSPEQMLTRYHGIKAAGLPYFVAVSSGKIIGYAYAALWHARSAYRFSVENSVYIAPGQSRRGVGRALVQATLDAVRQQGKTMMLSLISIMPDQGLDEHASVGLHRSLGANCVGRLFRVGRKFDKWIDVVWLQFDLTEGGDATPGKPGDVVDLGLKAKL